ncbi:hypothetical protein AAJ76_1890003039 [Vairimorpha ceranae]|uniref:Uncharacterized protein n=1 Tax=Vairimorpha ceranae TaxID=40302 RepID=A0A0F9WAC6_9MICR|nr:hypothetical protein AAJ76_1890003039 [Vairimorpha ceranae]KKO73880.1 hypothetical protein AAJ76_1890003039 [Vairimorpha ceranae]
MAQYLSVKEKYKIILNDDVRPKASHSQIKNIFDMIIKKYIDKSIIGKILSPKLFI